MYEPAAMTGREFEARVRRLATARGLDVHFSPHGKGSHGRLHLGDRFCTLKNRRAQIGPGLLRAMCSQLGIEPKDL